MRLHTLSRVVFGLALLTASAGAQAFDHDSLVWKKCTSCHAPDADGRISRVEQLRTTPEEWAVIVDRMRRLHGMSIGQGEMDRLLKELCATQILTPDEQARVSYLSLWHNSQLVEAPVDKDEQKVFTTCVRCHTAGKIYSYRMTPDSWAKLRDFHLFVVPTVVLQMREMHWVAEADAALAYLGTRLTYGSAWSAPPSRIDGIWSVFGYAPGRGSYRGEARIRDTGNAEYKLTGSVTHADGRSETFDGEATLYGGYALRTRTTNNGLAGNGAYIVSADEIRGESHLPAPDFRTSSARWLRAGDSPTVARIVPGFVLTGEKTILTVEGNNLPDAHVGDISFSAGAVKVTSVKRIAPGVLELTVVSGAPKLAVAKVSIKGVDAGTVTLAPRIDYIAITPPIGRARLSGGLHYPAEGVQFEAIAYARSGSGKKAVATPLGPVAATFRLAEEKTRPDDDDLRWLGTIGANGTYLPIGDYAPNPMRNYSAENSGLVKVLARYKRGARSFTAQALLAVTMPDFIARLR